MTEPQSRRRFLADVGKGTLWATIGPALASELGMVPAVMAEGKAEGLNFGDLEPLVRLMQDTPVAKLQPALVAQMNKGVPLQRLLAAGALANARSFGGEDYIGFHTMMALQPALKMAASMPEKEEALPVFKVLYRNTAQMQATGACEHEALQPVAPLTEAQEITADRLRDAVRHKDKAEAERLFATLVGKDKEAAFDALIYCVQDNVEVHRTVLPYRAWDMLGIVGQQHAQTLLRQSLRYCLKAESHRHASWDEHGRVLAKALDEHKLLGKEAGTRGADDAFVEKLSQTIFGGTPEQAAEAVAAALAEGFDPGEIGEAISLAANQLLLRDRGRRPEWESAGKPVGSVHGDSIGVHASDSIHAWRNLAQATQGRNRFACLILAAWQVARDRGPAGDFLAWEPVPSKYQLRNVKAKEAEGLLEELDEAIRGNLQAQAGAVVQRYGELGLHADEMFKVFLKYGVSEDGALHAEKYFQTVWDEFHRTRPAFRWRHLIGLARVTASEYGRPAPGQAEARDLLGV
ncbi:MAG TPA: hypothetical protein VD994_04845 [Prosthecobacter sp.]|nr:hypothetical protein [Prosthecobacter sp.]